MTVNDLLSYDFISLDMRFVLELNDEVADVTYDVIAEVFECPVREFQVDFYSYSVRIVLDFLDFFHARCYSATMSF